jgi:hypothetical protein
MGDLEFQDTHLPILTYNSEYKKINVCYIILTCEKYLNTRVKWQKETCFKDVPESDLYFLSCKEIKPNIYGWDTEDDYKSCITKYIKFFQNLTINYDWYMFIDDDTYVFPNRVEQYLANYDKTAPLYIGSIWTHLKNLRFTSGGAGFFITHNTYNKIKRHLSVDENTKIRYIDNEIYGDVTFGLWVRELNRKTPNSVKLISDWVNLNTGRHNSINHIFKAVTFHQVVEEDQFRLYNNYKYIVGHTFNNPIKSSILLLQTNLTIGSSKENMMRHCCYKLFNHKYDDSNEDFIFIIRKFPRGHVIESKNYPRHFITPNEDSNIYIKKGNCPDNKWEIEQSDGAFKFRSLSPNPKFKGKYLVFNNDLFVLSTNAIPLNIFFPTDR